MKGRLNGEGRAWGLALLAGLGWAWAVSPTLSPQATDSRERKLTLLPVETTTRIEDIQQSRDGRLLLTHDRGYAPKIWEAKRMKLLGYLTGHKEDVGWARFSPDGSKILSLSADRALVWDSKRLEVLASVAAPLGESLQLASWGSQSQSFGLATEKGLAGTFDLMGKGDFHKTSGAPSSLALNPDGTALALGLEDGQVVCLSSDGKARWSEKKHTSPPLWLAWSRDGACLLSTGLGGGAILWDTQGKVLSSLDHSVGEKGMAVNTQMGALFAGKDDSQIVTCDGKGSLWLHDRASNGPGREVKGNEAPVREVRVSPDGRLAATYCTDEVLRLWDLEEGKELPFQRPDDLPTAGEFSSDSSAFWVGTLGGSLRRHEARTGEVRLIQPGASLSLTGFQFFPQTSRLVMTAASERGEAFESVEEGLALSSLDPGRGAAIPSSSARPFFSPSGRYGLFPDRGGVEKTPMDLERGGAPGKSVPYVVRGLTYSENEAHAVFWQNEALVVRADPVTMEPSGTIGFGGSQSLSWAAISNDGKSVVAAGWDKKGKSRVVFGTFGEDVFYDFADANTPWCRVAFLNDDSQILVVDQDRIALHDAKTLNLIRAIPRKAGENDDTNFQVVQNRWVCTGGSGVAVYDLQTGVKVFEDKEASVSSRRMKLLSPDGRFLVVPDLRKVDLVELATGKAVASASSLSLVKDAGFMTQTMVGMADGAEGLVLLDAAKSLARVGRVVLMSGGTWLVTDEDGRFDAPDPNSVEGASYVLEWDEGREAIDVAQLKGQFYEPGLLAKLLGSDPSPRRAVPSLESLRLPPSVSLTKSDGGKVQVELEERDEGGRGEAVIKINGKVVERRRGAGFFTLDLSRHEGLLLPSASLPKGQTNWLTVSCFNEKGDLESSPESLDLGVPEGLQAPDIHLYALFVGVGDYVGQSGDLAAPPKDAAALAQGVSQAAERLLPGRVHVKVLRSGEEAPTRASITAWLEETAAKAKSSDILLVYFSGHGASQVGQESGYFFLTSDCDPSSLSAASLGSSLISASDLQLALSKIAASKQVVILDTCHSGAAAADLVSPRGPGSDYRRAYETLRDATGVWLLAGSAADQLSYESTQVDHGLLTYSLLEAIDRASPDGLRAGQDGELFLDVERWLTYAASRVDSLRNEVGIKGVQRPEMKRSSARSSFDLGVTRESNRGALGLKPPKPVVLISSFDQNEEDPLGLEPAVSAAFRLSEKVKAWFDIAKHPGVYRATGQYTNERGTVTVKVIVQKLDREMKRTTLETFEVKGSAAALPLLAADIRKGVEEVILKEESKK